MGQQAADLGESTFLKHQHSQWESQYNAFLIDELPRHVDFSHISSIALLLIPFIFHDQILVSALGVSYIHSYICVFESYLQNN